MNYSFAVTIIFSSNNHFLYVLSTKICLCPMVLYLIFIAYIFCRLFNPIDLWISILLFIYLLFLFCDRISILLCLVIWWVFFFLVYCIIFIFHKFVITLIFWAIFVSFLSVYGIWILFQWVDQYHWVCKYNNLNFFL